MEQTKVHVKRRIKRRKVCHYCVDKVFALDYKEVDKFRRFITDRGKIVPKRNSGMCARHQRVVAQAIKRARFIGLIPFCID